MTHSHGGRVAPSAISINNFVLLGNEIVEELQVTCTVGHVTVPAGATHVVHVRKRLISRFRDQVLVHTCSVFVKRVILNRTHGGTK